MRGWKLWVVVLVALLALWAVLGSEVRVLLVVLAGLGGYLALTSGAALLRKRREPALAAVPSELRPGESFVVRYGPPAMQPERLRGLRLRLICRELRRRPDGNGRTVTDKHDWVVEEADGPARGEQRFTVPVDAMHSFAARHHEIAWLVEAQGRVGGGGKPPSGTAELTVLPERYEP